MRSGKTVTDTAAELGVSAGSLHGWVRQDRMGRGEIVGRTTVENVELELTPVSLTGLG